MKKIFEDMVPNNRRSVRNIEVPDRSSSRRLDPKEPVTGVIRERDEVGGISTAKSVASLYGSSISEHETDPRTLKSFDPEQGNSRNVNVSLNTADKSALYPNLNQTVSTTKRKKNTLIWIIFIMVLLLVLTLIFWTFAFASVTIDVTTLSKDINLNGAVFVGAKNGGPTQVPFSVVTLSNEGVKKVSPSGQRQVSRAATGKVILYNAYSAVPQRLVRNTRLETPEGFIFRIADSVTVPGRTTTLGKDTPGSVTTSVIADTPGDKSNIKLSDFSIPGFKGDPRYTKFYGRSVEVFSGGYVGVEKVVSDDILHVTQKLVQADTLKGLTDQVKKNLGSDQILYDSGIYSETEMEPAVEDGNMVAIKDKVTIYAVVFARSDLAKYIAQSNILHFDNSPVTLTTPEDLKFTITNKDQVRPWIDSSFNFTLDGKTKITWIFDQEKLKQSLLGKPKQFFYVLLPTFPSISTATPHFNPAWKPSFPNSTKNIVIRMN